MLLNGSLIADLRSSFPYLGIESINDSLGGRFNQLFVINDEIVFRFPKYDWIAAKLPETTQVLLALRGRTTLPIPEATMVFCGSGRACLRYRVLRGEPLWLATMRSLDCATTERLARQLNLFLNELHSITPARLNLDGKSNLDSHEHWAGVYKDVRTRLFPSMTAESRSAVQSHFESHLDDAARFRYAPVFRHGDPGPGNILFDRASGELSGILDFDSGGFGDPALDWSIVLEPVLFGEDFCNRLLRICALEDKVLQRASFYRGNWIVNEALRALNAGEYDAFEREMANYR